MKFEKIFLDKKAESFILEKLKVFDDLGSKIIKRFSSSNHKIWGWFSNEISENDLIEFEYGGKFDERPMKLMTELIKTIIEENPEECWILIDNNGNTKYSPQLNAIEDTTTVFFYEGVVLHYFSAMQITNQQIEKTFAYGGAYPFVGFITKMKNNIKQQIFGNSVNSESLDFLINNITFLVIGAYDEEGYLIVEVK